MKIVIYGNGTHGSDKVMYLENECKEKNFKFRGIAEGKEGNMELSIYICLTDWLSLYS